MMKDIHHEVQHWRKINAHVVLSIKQKRQESSYAHNLQNLISVLVSLFSVSLTQITSVKTFSALNHSRKSHFCFAASRRQAFLQACISALICKRYVHLLSHVRIRRAKLLGDFMQACSSDSCKFVAMSWWRGITLDTNQTTAICGFWPDKTYIERDSQQINSEQVLAWNSVQWHSSCRGDLLVYFVSSSTASQYDRCPWYLSFWFEICPIQDREGRTRLKQIPWTPVGKDNQSPGRVSQRLFIVYWHSKQFYLAHLRKCPRDTWPSRWFSVI